MAARLDLIHLRRHALPAHFLASFGRAAVRHAAPCHVPDASDRPRLSAAWRLDGAGRLACTWSVDTDDPA